MKKLFALVTMTAVMLFTGCEDDIETSSLKLDMSNEATITTYVYAELDNTSQGPEYAPDGTKVIVSVDYSEFNPSANSGNWADTLTVNNGTVEATVPVSADGVTVDFTLAEFVHEQVQSPGAASPTIERIYSVPGGSMLPNVKPGESKIHEISYTSRSFTNETQTVSVKLQGQAIFDEETGDTENIPSGTSVLAYTSDWAETFTAGSNGILEVSVPYAEDVTFEFEAQKSVYNPETTSYENKNHKFTTNDTFFQSSPVTQTLSFSSQLWE